MRHSQCIWLIPPKSRTVDLDAANALDFRNLCVDLPVVIAGRDSELIALGTGEDADHGAGRRDGRDAGDDLFTDMRLFTFQNPNVPLGGGAVDRLPEFAFRFLRHRCAADNYSGHRQYGGPC